MIHLGPQIVDRVVGIVLGDLDAGFQIAQILQPCLHRLHQILNHPLPHHPQDRHCAQGKQPGGDQQPVDREQEAMQGRVRGDRPIAFASINPSGIA